MGAELAVSWPAAHSPLRSSPPRASRVCSASAVSVCGLLLLVCTAHESRASAWGLEQDEFSLELYTSRYYADSDFIENGGIERKPNNGRYSAYRTELKLEYGYSNRLDMLLYLPHIWSTYEDDNVTLENSGVSDARLGVKYMLWDSARRRMVAAMTALRSLPVGDGGSDNPPLGYGQRALELRFALGQSHIRHTILHGGRPLAHYRAWVGTELGYRRFEGDRADHFIYFLQCGLDMWKGVALQAEVDGVESVAGSGELEEDYAIVRLGLGYNTEPYVGSGAVHRRLCMGLLIGRTVDGRNTAEGQELVLKAIYRF